MATYVLVHGGGHGGGHGGWCYQRVARILRAHGHDVHTPTMTGLGERAHLLNAQVDLDRHIEDIAAVLQWEDLHEVILVGHSYGGMVITGTADRVRGRGVSAASSSSMPPHRSTANPSTTWPDPSLGLCVPSARSSTASNWSCCLRLMPDCSTG